MIDPDIPDLTIGDVIDDVQDEEASVIHLGRNNPALVLDSPNLSF